MHAIVYAVINSQPQWLRNYIEYIYACHCVNYMYIHVHVLVSEMSQHLIVHILHLTGASLRRLSKGGLVINSLLCIGCACML